MGGRIFLLSYNDNGQLLPTVMPETSITDDRAKASLPSILDHLIVCFEVIKLHAVLLSLTNVEAQVLHNQCCCKLSSTTLRKLCLFSV